jgi:hypothetical protein
VALLESGARSNVAELGLTKRNVTPVPDSRRRNASSAERRPLTPGRRRAVEHHVDAGDAAELQHGLGHRLRCDGEAELARRCSLRQLQPVEGVAVLRRGGQRQDRGGREQENSSSSGNQCHRKRAPRMFSLADPRFDGAGGRNLRARMKFFRAQPVTAGLGP